MELKEWVKAARSHCGWNQTQLGDAIGLTKGNISAWETGRHEPGFQQVMKISKVTGFAPPNWPFEGIDATKVQALLPAKLHHLEAAILIAASQLKLDVAAPRLVIGKGKKLA